MKRAKLRLVPSRERARVYLPRRHETTDERARLYARTLRPEPWRTARATQLDVAVSFVLGLLSALIWLHAFGSPF